MPTSQGTPIARPSVIQTPSIFRSTSQRGLQGVLAYFLLLGTSPFEPSKGASRWAAVRCLLLNLPGITDDNSISCHFIFFFLSYLSFLFCSFLSLLSFCCRDVPIGPHHVTASFLPVPVRGPTLFGLQLGSTQAEVLVVGSQIIHIKISQYFPLSVKDAVV